MADILEKMRTQEVYLENILEDCAIRYAIDGKYFVKFPGKEEYQVYPMERHELADDELAIYEDRDMIFDPIGMGHELTQEEYYNY